MITNGVRAAIGVISDWFLSQGSMRMLARNY
jgi:hypothetical protein